MNANESSPNNKSKRFEKKLGFFEKFLTIWVLLCIVIGIGLGKFFPGLSVVLSEFQYAHVSIPIAICLFFMIYPLLSIDLGVLFFWRCFRIMVAVIINPPSTKRTSKPGAGKTTYSAGISASKVTLSEISPL